MYNVLDKKCIITKVQIKYKNQGSMFNSKVWDQYYKLPFQSIKDTSLLWFQYQIWHRMLATNTFLFMIHYADTNICTFCNNYAETTFILWIHTGQGSILCKTGFWNKNWIVVHFDKVIVIFGMVNSKCSNIFNWLIINIQYYVYPMKMQKQKLAIASVQSILQNIFHIESYISYKNYNYEMFRNEWTQWLKLFIQWNSFPS